MPVLARALVLPLLLQPAGSGVVLVGIAQHAGFLDSMGLEGDEEPTTKKKRGSCDSVKFSVVKPFGNNFS